MSLLDTATKPLLPWLLLAAVMGMAASGAAGLYGGYEIATARYQKDQIALQEAHAETLNAKNEALGEAILRGNASSGYLLAAIRDIRVVNTTIHTRVQKETEKLVYTDCKVPATGIDLLQNHVDEVNLRLVRGNKK